MIRRISFLLKMILGLVGLVVALPAFAEWQMNMPEGVTPISRDMFDLHMIAIYVCAGIGVIVYGVMVYSIIMHRKSKGAVAAKFHDHFSLEIVWAVIPFIILVLLAIPATRVLQHMDDTSHADITIKITGFQWKWKYEYLDQGISFFSNLSTPVDQLANKEKKGKWYLLEVDKPLVLPTHHKIRFLVTANDVIHSWWVPDLGVKRDAIPGFIHESWAVIDKPGVYRGQSAELCGVHHGFMPIVVQALNDQDFSKWVANEKKAEDYLARTEADPSAQKDNMSLAELMKLGKEKYSQSCAVCHKEDGTGIPPLFPAISGSSIAIGDIGRHISIILKGVPGTAMQPFESQLTDIDVAAITTYERNAWINLTGDVIQPAAVAAVRKGEEINPIIKTKPKSGSQSGENK